MKTVDELNTYLKKRAKHKFIVVPFIYGYNEDGESIFTIYDDKIKSFSSAKNTKTKKGFEEYMFELRQELLSRYLNFSIVSFMKVGSEFFIPCCELSINTIKNKEDR